jgi:(E)-4-hydroxy-3-methylbut-2-enyl-diphosphate synthase
MTDITRRKARVVKIGNVYIGGNNPIAVQSMAKTETKEIQKTVRQIKDIEKAGCEIVRLAVKDNADAKALKKIKSGVNIAIVADIHFDWRLALEAINSGVDKIRLNPGNIYRKEQVREIAKAAKLSHIPIRVGVNSGSLRAFSSQLSALRTKSKSHTTKNIRHATAMVDSAMEYIKMLEGFGFYDIVVSLKASNIFDTIEAYRRIAKLCDYPLHLGVTATGSPVMGGMKSSIAIGALLLQGIGDTIRVSLTDNPKQEVKAAKAILEALGLRSFGPEIISCPTCGRCEVDLARIVKELEKKLTQFKYSNYQLSTINYEPPLKVAIMGCVVNGPGEAKEASLGIAFGRKEGMLFRNGKPVRKVSYNNCVKRLLEEITKNSK